MSNAGEFSGASAMIKVKSLESFKKTSGDVISDTELGIDKTTYQNSIAPQNTMIEPKIDGSLIWVIIIILFVMFIFLSIFRKFDPQRKVRKKKR